MTLDDLRRCRTSTQLIQAWRRLRTQLHPDHGGSLEAFDQARKLHDLLLVELRLPVPCGPCQGKGWREVGRGFAVQRVRCPACQGRGTVPRHA